jgi:hypothetical protein
MTRRTIPIVLLVLCVLCVSVASTASAAQYPGYKWVSGSVVGAHHHGFTVHHLWVMDEFNNRTYTCTVSLATWYYDRSDGWASCWGKPGRL